MIKALIDLRLLYCRRPMLDNVSRTENATLEVLGRIPLLVNDLEQVVHAHVTLSV